MKLCYRGVNYKSESVVFHQHKPNSLIKGKYRGLEFQIPPSIPLSHKSLIKLKYRGIDYTKGIDRSPGKTFTITQLKPVAI